MSTKDWIAEAKQKVATPEEAARLIASGQRVYVQGGCAVPTALVNAVVERYRELSNVEIVHLHTEGEAP